MNDELSKAENDGSLESEGICIIAAHRWLKEHNDDDNRSTNNTDTNIV